MLAHYGVGEGMQDGIVNHTGYTIMAQAEKLRTWLQGLGESTARRS